MTFLHRLQLRQAASRRGRRRGFSMLWLAFGYSVFFGLCAIVVDEGYWFFRRSEMQKAADAAAMAGVAKIAQSPTGNPTSAGGAEEAERFTALNGFKKGTGSIQVNTTVDETASTITVDISERLGTFFSGIIEGTPPLVSVRAVAQFSFTSRGSLSITGLNYGLNDGPINIGLYGPEQISERGDRYSTRYKASGNSIINNPDYRAEGYYFGVKIPQNFGDKAILQIYDPDSYDSGADSTSGNKQWDEGGKDRYGPNGQGTLAKIGSNKETKTKYTLYSDNGTPYDTTDDVLIESKTIGADQSKDKKWDNTFTFNPIPYRTANPAVNFVLNATTVEGSNENGFNIRAARPTDTDDTFRNGGNGSDVSAIGTLPVNFGLTGTGEVVLGSVPAGATTVTVNHFDSDVGVRAGDRIQYSYTNTSGGTSPTYYGSPLLAGNANDKVETDVLDLSNSNYTGGVWKARYSAGLSDNTTWDLQYEGPPTGSDGGIRLIG